MNTPVALPAVSKRAARVSISAFFFLAGICFASWASRIPDIKLHLHLDDAEFGTVLLALPVGLITSLPFSGWLVTLFGSRNVVLTAAVLYSCILPVLGLADSFWQLAAILFVFGLTGNMLNISINTQAVSLEALYGRSIMASFHGIWSTAGFCGAFIGAVMINFHLTPIQHFSIVSVSVIVLAAIVHRYTLRQDINTDTDRPLFAKPDATLLKLGLIALCCMMCEGAMFEWSGVYFQKVVQPPKGLIILGYTAFMSTMAGGRFIGDWLTTRFGIKTILKGSGLIIASGLVLAISYPGLFLSTAGFMLVGIGVSSVVPLVYSTAGKSTRFSPGVALAAVSTIGYLGFLGGPPLIGFIAQASSLRWSFALIAVLGITATIISAKTKFNQTKSA